MKNLIILIFILLISNIYSQNKCPESLSYDFKGNSGKTHVYVYTIDLNYNIVDSIVCNINGSVNSNIDKINCPDSLLNDTTLYMLINKHSTCLYYGKTQSKLPIELVNFSLDKYNGNARVNWTTGSELNNDYFTIERSFDNYTWKEIDRIDGAGNSSSLIDYSYIDKQFNLSNIVYYRLKQTDYDGKFERFHIKSINMGDREVVKVLNLLGQEVDMNYKGLKIIIYNNGDRIKTGR